MKVIIVLLMCALAPLSQCAYDYKLALKDSLLFYEAQRSGKLPADNRVKWRGDSMLNDGKDVGVDLTGGYFDAGDLVKFNFPQAYAMTVLGWGLVDYEKGYTSAGQLDYMRAALKWGTDYFIKCHQNENTLWGQVGNGGIDHSTWTRPEDWPADKARPSYKSTSAKGGSDLAGETAAALAAASIAFKTANPAYSATLLSHAKSLYTFADKYRSVYTAEITDAETYYKSFSGYGDELAWAAAWLLRATNDNTYKTAVEKHFNQFSGQLNGKPSLFGWDDKTAGVQVLMAQITGDQKYKTMAQAFCDNMINSQPKTPKGLLYLGEWGSLRNAANVAFICTQAAKVGINANTYQAFAEKQLNYILGDTGRSFVVGFGVNPPTQPHHRGSSCPNRPTACGWDAMNAAGPNPQSLIGALVGGPDNNDNYSDSRQDYIKNEVTLDYNAGFQSLLASYIANKNL